jgi:hypothetical protein
MIHSPSGDKHFRRTAIRFDKLAGNLLAAVALVSARF